MANESKEETKEELETKAMLVDIEPVHVPISVTSFADLDAMNEAEEIVNDMKRSTTQFAEMAENIFLNFEIEDKPEALQSLAVEFADRIAMPLDDDDTKEDNDTKEESHLDEGKKWQPLTDKVTNVIKGFFGDDDNLEDKEDDNVKKSSFDVWENKETGQLHWLAVYSNNIIDKEQEIISSDSHKRFVDMVDKGLAPLPELWMWHRPEWKWGQATAVAYDNNGFAVATGIVDDNQAAKELADWVKEFDDISVSHGMPKRTVKRDTENENVIIEHITREVSPLFTWRAANNLTDFSILKESTMQEKGILEEKRAELIANGVSPETLQTLETQNQDTAKEVEDAGLETKEEDTKKETQPDELKEVIEFLVSEIKSLKDEVKELKTGQVENFQKEVQSQPPATLLSYTQSLFKEDNSTKADRPAGPKEAPLTKEGEQPFFFEWMQ